MCVCAHARVCEIGKLVKKYTCLPLQCLPLNIPWHHSYSTPPLCQQTISFSRLLCFLHSFRKLRLPLPTPLHAKQSTQGLESSPGYTPVISGASTPRLPGSRSPASWVHHQGPAADSQRGLSLAEPFLHPGETAPNPSEGPTYSFLIPLSR